jgi:lipopolysaccharide transport protein LptA
VSYALLLGALLSRPVEISADRLEVLDTEHKAIYRGHARAVRDTTTLSCSTLTVHYSESKEVTRIEADGDVEAIDQDRHAWGEHADFDNHTGVLKVTGSPRAQSGERKVTGEEITFTNGSDRLEVTHPHTTDAELTIDADRLALEADRRVATWEGHVKAKKATTQLWAPTLLARYDDKGAITRVEARGGVEVRDKERWAKGARADYDAVAGRLTVTGKPEARQGNSRITGRSVTFVSGSDTLEVEEATSVIDVKDAKDKKEKAR